MVDDILALANSICFLAVSRSGRHVPALICAGLIAPCGAVFAVDCRQHAGIYLNKAYKIESLGKEGYSSKKEKKKGRRLAGK